ncbi:MAG: hypothetical protein FJZ00_01845 [Candidatus Sericytochromatia bacterium]|uniref:Uncharacterized protein n=1 Tax=Candidatus Tanganyikabacteria bacterium TaxID=2961651 RepID=A0A937X420_9BACT|nr:hypothetical protein [Candidatus Tanganyikabacteria bacterium]
MPRFGTAQSPKVELDPGGYVVTLKGFRDAHEPRGRFADPEKGQSPDDIIHNVYWQFEEQDSGQQLELRSSPSCGEKSNFLKLATALCGGVMPCPPGDTSYDWDNLLGKQAIGNITQNEKGYRRLSSLSALPKGMAGKQPVSIGVPTHKTDSYGNPIEGYDDPDEDPAF